MGADFTVKATGASAPVDYSRLHTESRASFVATDLPAQQTVAPAAATNNAANNPDLRGEDVSRQVLFDRAAAEVVYRVVDNRTDRVVRQIPEQAMLRLRAYTRAASAQQARASSDRRYADQTV